MKNISGMEVFIKVALYLWWVWLPALLWTAWLFLTKKK
jgi:hypothetical protein